MKSTLAKLISLTLAVLTVAALLGSCSSGAGSETTDTIASNTTEANNTPAETSAEYKLVYISSNETGAGDTYKWAAVFSLMSDGNTVTDTANLSFTATAKITNASGTVVYEGVPTISAGDSLIKCTVNYEDVATGNTTLGKGTITLSLNGISATGEENLDLLPYDMAEIAVPALPLSVNKIAGDGSVTSTMEITEISKELRYRGETVNVRINIKGKRTFTSGANDYIGTSVVVTVAGQEIKKGSILNKVDANGEITGYISFEYKVGSDPVVTFGDYK